MPGAAPIYELEWDPEKARTNRRKHGVCFEEAATIFLDPRALSLYDEAHSDTEDRWITLGISSVGRLLVISHTFRRQEKGRCALRIISGRKATKQEARTYGQ